MKKVMALFLALSLAFLPVAFGFGAKQDNVSIGIADEINCSTGITCTFRGSQIDLVSVDGTLADIRSGSIYGVTVLAFNGAVGALNTWQGIDNGIEFISECFIFLKIGMFSQLLSTRTCYLTRSGLSLIFLGSTH